MGADGLPLQGRGRMLLRPALADARRHDLRLFFISTAVRMIPYGTTLFFFRQTGRFLVIFVDELATGSCSDGRLPWKAPTNPSRAVT
jgi:hypothetical protein